MSLEQNLTLCYRFDKDCKNWTCKTDYNPEDINLEISRLEKLYENIECISYPFNKNLPPIIQKIILTKRLSRIDIPTLTFVKK
jgi:hypothetical protein